MIPSHMTEADGANGLQCGFSFMKQNQGCKGNEK
jgi:hypothetical protein